VVQDYDEWQKWYRETTWPPGVEKQSPPLAWREAARSAWVDVLLGMSLGAVLWGLGPAPWHGWWWLIAVVVPVVVIVGGGMAPIVRATREGAGRGVGRVR
jgi:hypothetical protein